VEAGEGQAIPDDEPWSKRAFRTVDSMSTLWEGLQSSWETSAFAAVEASAPCRPRCPSLPAAFKNDSATTRDAEKRSAARGERP
jgi:hypothetical protein